MSSRIVGRGFERNLDAGSLQPMISSFELHLRAEKKSPKTIRTYIEAAQWLAAEYLIPNGIKFWADVTARHVQEWTVTLLDRYSDSYANNQFRALQQFFKWHATEDPDEPRPNPMANLKPPKVSDKLVPVFTEDELAAMLATCKGGGFQNRRDCAVISLFKDAGLRLSELAGLGLDDVSPASREATVTGKGDKQRTVRFTYDTARALDRYSRERAKLPMARVSALWLGVRGGPMTASGIYQMIERRGREVGVEVNPHKFRHILSALFPCRDSRHSRASGPAVCAVRLPPPRCRLSPNHARRVSFQRGRPTATRTPLHTVSADRRHPFSHNWLDNGGAEGDLMELNGWSSPQMLARYGRSARSARARRHYDDVMGG
jgi:site-specific recombinase XerD